MSADDPHQVVEFGRSIEKAVLVKAKQFTEGQPIQLPFRLVSDNSREAIRKLGIGEEHPRFGLIARPTTILLDKEGMIHWLHNGKTPSDRPSVDEVLQLLTSWP